MEKLLTQKVIEALKSIYQEEIPGHLIQIQKTRKEFEGDLTLVTFPLLKASKKSPEQTGDEIGKYLLSNVEELAGFNVVKGFLNISFSNKYWLDFFKSIVNQDNYGFAPPSGKTIMVEYSSPNTNKPLHLGHVRNNLLGYSVAEIMKANGHHVIKVQVVNDRGIHICKSMLAWQKWGNGETPESSGTKGDKLVGKYYVEFDKQYKQEIEVLIQSGTPKEIAEKTAPLIVEAQEMLRKWEAKDPQVYALWEKMNNWCYQGFDITYKQLGVDFDKMYYESETYLEGKKYVEEGVRSGVFTKKDDGSVWVDLTAEGLDEKLLLRSDGTAVYMTQDIGTAIQRYSDYPTLSQLIYTVGNEQDYHFKVLFLILQKLGFDWAKECYHLSYGMVDLPTGKMKSREGTVVDADDLMNEMTTVAKSIAEELGKLDDLAKKEQEDLFSKIGLGALKYHILKVDPRKRMMFNPEESVDFNGNTGPFIQYTHARISSVLRKFEGSTPIVSDDVVMEPSEKELVKLIYDYPEVIKEAGEKYSPATIANYSYEIVKAYNHFYQNVPILKSDDPNIQNFRIQLSLMVKNIIASSMRLLGIYVPERM